MLDSLATPVVAIAIILGITFPIWLLVLFARLVYHTGRIADALEDIYLTECGKRGVNVGMRSIATK